MRLLYVRIWTSVVPNCYCKKPDTSQYCVAPQRIESVLVLLLIKLKLYLCDLPPLRQRLGYCGNLNSLTEGTD